MLGVVDTELAQHLLGRFLEWRVVVRPRHLQLFTAPKMRRLSDAGDLAVSEVSESDDSEPPQSPRPGPMAVSIDRIREAVTGSQCRDAANSSHRRAHVEQSRRAVGITGFMRAVTMFGHWTKSIAVNPRICIEFHVRPGQADVVLPYQQGWNITCGVRETQEWRSPCVRSTVFSESTQASSPVFMTARQVLEERQRQNQSVAAVWDSPPSLDGFYVAWNRQVIFDHFESGCDIYRERRTEVIVGERSLGPDKTLTITCTKNSDGDWVLRSISYHLSLIDLYVILSSKSTSPPVRLTTRQRTKGC